jgi:hypothetical protein
LLMDWAMSKVVLPDAYSRTAPSGKVMLIIIKDIKGVKRIQTKM